MTTFRSIIVTPTTRDRSLELARCKYRCRVVERSRVGHSCLNTHCYSRLMLDKNGDRAGHLWGSVEPLEGKGGESVVAILRFSMW
jgi:hypothetical protein